MAKGAPFAFVQLEFGFALGPPDGRYLSREPANDEPRWVLVLATLGAPQRRLLNRRGKPKRIREADPEPVPTSRATLIHTPALQSPEEAERWLTQLRARRDRLAAEVTSAARELNGVIRAHRAAAADPYSRDVTAPHALAARVGYGTGEEVAHGHFSAACEIAPATLDASGSAPLGAGGRGRSRRAELIAPQERLAAIVGGREAVLPSEELVLRARADLDAARPREAALQARIALESLLAEDREPGAGDPPAPRGDASRERHESLIAELEHDRDAVSRAANAALSAEPSAELNDAVAAAVERMEREVRRRRLERL